MIGKSKAIVLHHIKYSETSIIVYLYTQAWGRQSYILNGVRSPKSKIKTNLFQPLSLMQIEAYHKPGRDLQRLKEFKLDPVYTSIPFEIAKSTISLFLAELLNKVLKSEDPDQLLFDFILDSLVFFDSMESGSANFHLWFLTKLLTYLGYQLENNHDDSRPFFDLKAGSFVPQRPSYPNTPDTEISHFLSGIMGLKLEDLAIFKLEGKNRSKILEALVECYSIHFDGLGTFNSLKILQEIYH